MILSLTNNTIVLNLSAIDEYVYNLTDKYENHVDIYFMDHDGILRCMDAKLFSVGYRSTVGTEFVGGNFSDYASKHEGYAFYPFLGMLVYALIEGRGV